MKGFIVFEVASPFRWKPAYERDITGGPFHRIIWAWFSVTVVFGMKLTEFIDRLESEQSTGPSTVPSKRISRRVEVMRDDTRT